MGSKGYFNPRMKTKDFNRKRNETFQKPDPKGMHKKLDGLSARAQKRARKKGDSQS